MGCPSIKPRRRPSIIVGDMAQNGMAPRWLFHVRDVRLDWCVPLIRERHARHLGGLGLVGDLVAGSFVSEHAEQGYDG